MKSKKMKVATKLTLGFMLVALILALSGIISIIMIRIVGDKTDEILYEKVPFKDISMEAIIALISTRDASAEYLLNTENLQEIESEIVEGIEDFDMWISMVRYGTESEQFKNSEAGEMYNKDGLTIVSPKGTEQMIEIADNAESDHIVFTENIYMLVDARDSELYSYTELDAAMEIFDNEFASLSETLLKYEETQTTVEGMDAAMEAKFFMANQKAIIEEYAGIDINNVLIFENSGGVNTITRDENLQNDLKGEYNKFYERYMSESIYFPEYLKESYNTFYQAGDEIIQKKDTALDNALDTKRYMITADSKAALIEEELEKLEDLSDTEMSLAMTDADNAQSTVFMVMIILTVTGFAVAIILGIAITRSITKPLGGEPDEMANIATSISEGDLTVEFENRKYEGAYGAMKKMADNLVNIITNVKAAAGNVSSGSQELSSSAQEMSQGSTEQASSTEEVSSSMEEMASNIRQNADNAMETEKIAISAAKNAEQSGDAVTNAVSAMNEIANRITIIEEIARQTNLLALNAAIEAARAGEHGKGFAVVASEVRKLAERSQKAAGEISLLSVSTVETAVKAGEMLVKLVPDIKKTAELVQEISASSREQDKGVEQINNAILQLDNVVQQNASASEEVASTSEELASQAEQLETSISFFRTKVREYRASGVKEVEYKQKSIEAVKYKKLGEKRKIKKTDIKTEPKPENEGKADDLDSDFEEY